MLVTLKVGHRQAPEIQRRLEAEHALEGVTEHCPRAVADLERGSVIESVGATYQLTPGEVRVLRAVVDVGGIREIAAALAISPTTVKTHLRHIFQKTGAKGQVDLIRLVTRAASRLVG